MRRSWRSIVAVAPAALGLAWPAAAEVVERSADGFTIRVVAQVAAPPAAVYASLVDGVGEWWDPEHTYSGRASNLSIQARPGGCFCETLPGGGVEHARVVNAQPGRILRLDGALGPLQHIAVTGRLTWQLDQADRGTRLTLTYAVAGRAPGGLDSLAAVVDTVLARQVTLLAAHAGRSAGAG
jgi:uncharacterized protein YndB with AHSA1/START domain